MIPKELGGLIVEISSDCFGGGAFCGLFLQPLDFVTWYNVFTIVFILS